MEYMTACGTERPALLSLFDRSNKRTFFTLTLSFLSKHSSLLMFPA
jgi:hypothetical protein